MAPRFVHTYCVEKAPCRARCCRIVIGSPSPFRGALVDILERGDLPPAPKFTNAELAMPFGAGVRALREGEAFTFYRESLPAQHPLRHVGGLYDVLLLTAANKIVSVD